MRSKVSEALLEAIPETVTSELVGSRRLHPAQILFRIMQSYAPGGPGERQALLGSMLEVEECVNPAQGLKVLRDWFSDVKRAESLNLVVPDPSQLLGAIDWATEQWIALNAQRSFRVSIART